MRVLFKVLGSLGVLAAMAAVGLVVFFTTKVQAVDLYRDTLQIQSAVWTSRLIRGLTQAPRPHPEWTGIRPAKKPGAKCPQGQNGELDGSEDCLFLNVFSTNLNGATKQPVYVFFHGGRYQYGSPSITSFGPDYLLPHGIVLVTVQYRVHALGFLSLDTEEIPGNCAVKDSVAAVQWVHDNIAAFGGDPGRVTVGGQSAGGGMAGWLAVLPELTGVIHGATLMSGTAFHTWDYTESHVATALKVVSRLAGQPVTDLKLAEQYLMNATIEELHAHAVVVVNGEMLETWRPCPGQSFKTFAEFQELFEDFQERSHSVWVRNSSQTVAQANEYLEKKNAELIDAALVYKNIMFTCKFGGKQRGRIGFTDDQRAQKVRCHAEILLAYNHVSKALVIRSVNLDHNHHL